MFRHLRGTHRAPEFGAIAQLGERYNGIVEVRSSILLGSTNKIKGLAGKPAKPFFFGEPQGNHAERITGNFHPFGAGKHRSIKNSRSTTRPSPIRSDRTLPSTTTRPRAPCATPPPIAAPPASTTSQSE